MTTFYAEIPGLYLDALALDTSTATPVLANRDPEPAETNVPLASLVTFDLIATGSSALSLATVQVWIAGVLAYSASAFQAGFAGVGSLVSAPASDTTRIAIDPTSNFASQQVVPVRVVARTVDGSAIDTTYTFTATDRTPPRLISANALDMRTVRVVFDEPVQALSSTVATDALDPANYTLVAQNTPAVAASVTSVTPVTDTTLDLTTSLELSFDRTYAVVVAGVNDLSGNAIEAPYNTASFVAYRPPAPANRRFNIYRDMLRDTDRREDDSGDLRSFAAILQDVADLKLAEIDAFTDILDPDRAPEVFVDAMLADLGNPFDFMLSLIDKRRLAQVLVPMYQQKGTRPGIINAVRFFLGIEVDLRIYAADGWILGDDELGETTVLAASAGSAALFSFDVIAPRVLTADERLRIRALATYMKGEREHLRLIVEPTTPEVIDHVELGLSELGTTFVLH